MARFFGQGRQADHYREFMEDVAEDAGRIMQLGPYLYGHELRIPSQWYDPRIAGIWARRGFTWHKTRREWRRLLPEDRALEQLVKAREFYAHLWKVELSTTVEEATIKKGAK